MSNSKIQKTLLKISSSCVQIFIGFFISLHTSISAYANTKDVISNEKNNPLQEKSDSKNNFQEYQDFEEIVDDLSEIPQTTNILTFRQEDTLSNTIFHGGLGFSYAGISLKEKNKSHFKSLKGLNITFGIHLFSPVWLSEADFRFFGPLQLENTQMHMSEFNLKLIYKPYLKKYLHMKIGFGFLNRYLTLKETNKNLSSPASKETRYKSPALNTFLGFEIPITSFISVSSELELALPLVKENRDNQSIETIIKLNTYF